MIRLDLFRAARTGVHGLADAFTIDTVADTHDHENHLQLNENDCQTHFMVKTNFYARLILAIFVQPDAQRFEHGQKGGDFFW